MTRTVQAVLATARQSSRRRLLPLLALAMLATACGQSAKPTYDDMHAAACRGDADAFFAKMDESAVLDNAVERQHGVPRTAVAAFMRETVTRWRKDITDAGANGFICRWQFVGLEKHLGRQRVEIKTASGEQRYMWFSSLGNEVKWVDFESSSRSEGAFQ